MPLQYCIQELTYSKIRINCCSLQQNENTNVNNIIKEERLSELFDLLQHKLQKL